MNEEAESSSSSESEVISPYERTFHLLQKEKEECSSDEEEKAASGLTSESDSNEEKDGDEKTLIPFSSNLRSFSNKFLSPLPANSCEKLPQQKAAESPILASEHHLLISSDHQRNELDKLILAIISKEEKCGSAVSDLRIKEKLLEQGKHKLIQWALQKIPGPVGMYGYTSLLQKTTEMHLGIRRLLDQGKLAKRTKRTYIINAPKNASQIKTAQGIQPTIPELDHNEIHYDQDGCRRSKRPRKGLKWSEEDDDNSPILLKQELEVVKPLMWPPSVEYTPNLINSYNLSQDAKLKMDKSAISFVSNVVKIGVVESINRGEWGLFATQDLEACKILGEYTGKLRMSNSCQKEGHSLSISFDEFSIDIDAEVTGNEFRYINDYKSTGKENPNVKFESVPLGGEWHILVVTTHQIKKGEELVADFGHSEPSIHLETIFESCEMDSGAQQQLLSPQPSSDEVPELQYEVDFYQGANEFVLAL